ncbi:MAG: GNAT family protein [Pseudomonadales bacterium]|jgi:RimJ/RimL family protein N-acetyltransferase|nr:GNAT family protein [Pseudomonadales bacterium]
MKDPAELRTERLRLRPTRPDDARAILDLFDDEETTRYWAHRPLPDLDAAEAWIAERLARRARGELLDWFAELDRGHVAGLCFIGDLSIANRRGEIGYAIHRDQQGRGLASEMVTRVISHAFESLGLHRLEADVDPRNAASLRLLEQHGFTVEGHLRERWQATGEVQDSVILGLLAPEWRAAR